jgi:hypothetical protein
VLSSVGQTLESSEYYSSIGNVFNSVINEANLDEESLLNLLAAFNTMNAQKNTHTARLFMNKFLEKTNWSAKSLRKFVHHLMTLMSIYKLSAHRQQIYEAIIRALVFHYSANNTEYV